MKEFIMFPLLVNVLFFISGIILGVVPGTVTISNPGGFVYIISYSTLLFSFITIGILVALLGIKVLGSGLSDASIQIINRCVVYFTLWGFLSTISFAFLYTFEVFGIIIYAVLTILYSIGVFVGIGDMDTSGGKVTVIGGSE